LSNLTSCRKRPRFAGRIADRIHIVEGFTEDGRASVQRMRPALPVLFVYAPANGTVLLQSPLRSVDRVRELFEYFGRAVLGTTITPRGDVFDLDRLKLPFQPLPDAEDMESVRLKAVHLRYPERSGRRQLKLETLADDVLMAMDDLRHAHVGDEAALKVTHAELQVRLRVNGHPKNYPARLWPDRCSLDRSALGSRLLRCLRHGNLTHA